MGDCAQIFQSMALFLQGIIGGSQARYLNLFGVYLKGLLRFGSKKQRSQNVNRAAYAQLAQFLKVIDLFLPKNHLNAFKAAAVGKLHKTKSFASSYGSYPTAYL